MKKTKFNVVCIDVDHSEGGAYIASFVPADEKLKDKLKDGFRVGVSPEELPEGEEPDTNQEPEPSFVVGELYEMTIQKPKQAEDKKELSEEEKAKIAEAKAKKAENDRASKAKKKAEDDAKKKAEEDAKKSATPAV